MVGKSKEIDTLEQEEKFIDDLVNKVSKAQKEYATFPQEKVDETIAAIKEGSLHVFDTGRFTVEGKVLESYRIDLDGDLLCDDNNEDAEAIKDGYFHESELRSAPAFDIRIDGITEVN